MTWVDRVDDRTQPPWVIAEIGSNHDGDLDLACAMIEACADAGADVVKFQSFRRESLFAQHLPDDGTPGRRRDQELLRKRWKVLPGFTLDPAWWPRLQDVAASNRVAIASTPFALDQVDRAASLSAGFVKIASGDLTWHELIDKAARSGCALVLSTGASTLGEVEAAVTVAQDAGVRHLTLLHCVSSYPTDWEEANVGAMSTLREHFGLPVGLSDHSPGHTLPVAATALGARVIEKHVTIDRSREGLDHFFALEMGELRALVDETRHAHAGLGNGEKTFASSEEVERFWVRRGVWAARDIPAGRTIMRDDLTVVRPVAGLPADRLADVVGRPASRDIEAGMPISTEDLA